MLLISPAERVLRQSLSVGVRDNQQPAVAGVEEPTPIYEAVATIIKHRRDDLGEEPPLSHPYSVSEVS